MKKKISHPPLSAIAAFLVSKIPEASKYKRDRVSVVSVEQIYHTEFFKPLGELLDAYGTADYRCDAGKFRLLNTYGDEDSGRWEETRYANSWFPIGFLNYPEKSIEVLDFARNKLIAYARAEFPTDMNMDDLGIGKRAYLFGHNWLSSCGVAQFSVRASKKVQVAYKDILDKGKSAIVLETESGNFALNLTAGNLIVPATIVWRL